MATTLTPKQKAVFEFIKRYILEHDYSPSFREIARQFKLSSVATVAAYVEALRKKGYLIKVENLARSLQLTPAWDERHFEVPLEGTIQAGEPIEAIRTNDTIEIPRDMIGPNTFALRVRGDSMIEDGIFEGDYIIVDQIAEPKNGDIVVALIDQDTATLKRFYREKKTIRLQAANKKYPPIRTRRVTIQGRVKGVIRKFV